jgi:nucleoside-diphosphate-sugar epimerase
MSEKVVITGATGWLGQEFLFREYLKFGDKFLDNYILVGNQSRTINLFQKFSTKVYSLADFSYNGKVSGIIHLAFILRHRVVEFGIEDFLQQNKAITNCVIKLIKLNRPNWIVNISSGAIFDRATGELETNATQNPYGFGKYMEELALREIALKNDIPVVIGRLWGASGIKMPPNSAYALSDFVSSAILRKKITISSNFEVFRRYCDGGEFLDVLVHEAKTGNSVVLNSGGPLHEIGEIAGMISRFIGGVSIERPPLLGPKVDDYFPRESTYESLALKHGISLASMKTQIQRTLDGHNLLLRDR